MSSFMNYYCQEVCSRNRQTCDRMTLPQPGQEDLAQANAWSGECERIQTLCYAGCVPNNRESLYATTPDLDRRERFDALTYIF